MTRDAGSDLLRRVRALRVKATPGPATWSKDGCRLVVPLVRADGSVMEDGDRIIVLDLPEFMEEGDKAFIACVYSDWDAILAAVRAEEREACAQIAETYRLPPADPRFNPLASYFNEHGHPVELQTRKGIADALRHDPEGGT